jgi:hypothetical protein
MLKTRIATYSGLSEMKMLFMGTVTTVCSNDYNPDQIQAWISVSLNDERWKAIIEHQYVVLVLKTDTMSEHYIEKKPFHAANLAVQNHFDNKKIRV